MRPAETAARFLPPNDGERHLGRESPLQRGPGPAHPGREPLTRISTRTTGAHPAFLHRPGTDCAYRISMCQGTDGELEGQSSINELLVAMGQAPVEPLVLTAAPDDASSLFDGAQTPPGLGAGDPGGTVRTHDRETCTRLKAPT